MMKKLTFSLLTILLAFSSALAQSDETAATWEAFTRYLDSNHTDLSILADDVEITYMATGEKHTGREAIGEMLHYVYHVASTTLSRSGRAAKTTMISLSWNSSIKHGSKMKWKSLND